MPLGNHMSQFPLPVLERNGLAWCREHVGLRLLDLNEQIEKSEFSVSFFSFQY